MSITSAVPERLHTYAVDVAEALTKLKAPIDTASRALQAYASASPGYPVDQQAIPAVSACTADGLTLAAWVDRTAVAFRTADQSADPTEVCTTDTGTLLAVLAITERRADVGVGAGFEDQLLVGTVVTADGVTTTGVISVVDGEIFVGTESVGDAGFTIDGDGIGADAEYHWFAGATGDLAGTVTLGGLPIELSLEGSIGVSVDAEANVRIGPDGVSAHAGASVFAGATVESSVGTKVGPAKVGAHGGAAVGVGVDASLDAEIGWNKVSFEGEVTAAVGVGFTGGIDLEVSPKETYEWIDDQLPDVDLRPLEDVYNGSAEILDNVIDPLAGAGKAIGDGLSDGADVAGETLGVALDATVDAGQLVVGTVSTGISTGISVVHDWFD